MFASTITRLILLFVASLWMANGKPAEPIESISGYRESRQLFYVPHHHGPWPLLVPPQHGSYFQHHDYDDSVMDRVDPVTQQRWMEALLASATPISNERKQQQPSLDDESGLFNSTNSNRQSANKSSVASFTSKNPGQTPTSAGNSDFNQQHEFVQLEGRPDVQAFVNQTIQTVMAAVIQAVIAQLMG